MPLASIIIANGDGKRTAVAPKLPPAKTSSCAIATNGYLNHMDWQKIAALGVVAATAIFFLRAKLRRRKFSFEHDTRCGCTTAGAAGARTSIIFSARKGGRAKIIVKNN